METAEEAHSGKPKDIRNNEQRERQRKLREARSQGQEATMRLAWRSTG
tara:strand:- start:7823 stop:7966 length:144 start_codon:yes stop_codon:yes gene_type:complete